MAIAGVDRTSGLTHACKSRFCRPTSPFGRIANGLPAGHDLSHNFSAQRTASQVGSDRFAPARRDAAAHESGNFFVLDVTGFFCMSASLRHARSRYVCPGLDCSWAMRLVTQGIQVRIPSYAPFGMLVLMVPLCGSGDLYIGALMAAATMGICSSRTDCCNTLMKSIIEMS